MVALDEVRMVKNIIDKQGSAKHWLKRVPYLIGITGTPNVNILTLMAWVSMDEKMEELLHEKREMADGIVNEGNKEDMFLIKMTTKQIKWLLSL